jgi:hypothetical protein
MVYRATHFSDQYEYRKGLTYAISATTFVPRAIWKGKPLFVKKRAGTEFLGGLATQTSHRVYGLAGEAILNFGLYGIVPSFMFLGLILGIMRKKITTLYPDDSRFFFIPVFCVISIFLVISDSDNFMFALVKMTSLPFLVVYFGSLKTRIIRE